MNRVACFAHYDKNNKIEDYVVFYLKELKKISQKIIFVSDSNITKEELDKIKSFIDFSIVGKHGEYDFGSYKIGYLYAKEQGFLEDADELIFANDSCYAPLFPFEEMFSKMSPRNIDFWGATKNHYGYKIKNGQIIEKNIDHIQSYFIVFKNNVFNTDIFKNFINSICKKTNKNEIISEYEVGITELLTSHNYKWDVYSNISKNNQINCPILAKYREIIEIEKIPFLKRNLVLLKEYKFVYPFRIKKLITKFTEYNYELIRSDIKHNKMKISMILKLRNIIKIIRRSILRIHSRDKEIIIFGKIYTWNINKK